MAAPNLINVSSVYGKSMGAELGTGLTTDILTCPSNKVLKVNTILASNVDGTFTASLTAYFYDSSAGTRYPIASTISVPANATLVVLGKDSPIYLEEGDQIEAGATAPNDLTLVVSYEELDDA